MTLPTRDIPPLSLVPDLSNERRAVWLTDQERRVLAAALYRSAGEQVDLGGSVDQANTLLELRRRVLP